ncbi:MAG: hypothetical protein LQ338_004637 [Usnochroma carphineum]|nr:MAG: hypothetical protein LQ338_004637 [Usnochroma carphineum]
MASQLEALTGEPPPDPDAQATVTDFLDYTEYLPSDLVRSLTLIGKLDEAYLDCTDQIHALTKAYGLLPTLPLAERQNAQHLRQQISYQLDRAISARESAYAEAARLFEAVDRHSSRLTSISAKLKALPKPPSRDPTPAPRSPQATRSKTATKGTEGTARITLHGPRPVTSTTAAAQRSRQRSRKITVPGEVLPPPNPDSPPLATDSEWESAPPSPLPMPTSRVGGPSRSRPTGTVRIRPPKPPKQPKQKMARPPRPPGQVGTNVHSAVAGISTSNALSLLSPPPVDAKPGSEHAPWMRLTEYEMAKLRKRMKKNAIWSPSETMIRRELADAGRGPENYRSAKANSDAVGDPFIDDDNLASRPPGQPLQPGEISADSLAFEETSLSNRGMKLNEAKKIKREAMLKEQQAEAEQIAKLEVEQAAKRLGDIGSTIKNLFSGATNFVYPSSSSSASAQAKALEKAKEKEREKEKEKEKQRLKEEKAREKERERQKELARQEEVEKAKAREKEELEREKQRQLERDRQEQLEKERREQEALEKQRLEQEQLEREAREKAAQEAQAREEQQKAREEEERAIEAEREALANKASKKRKREPVLEINVPAPGQEVGSEATPSPKKRRTAQAEPLSDTVSTKVPLAAPGPSSPKVATPAPLITPAIETRRSTRRPSLTLRGPAAPAESIEALPRSATRASNRRTSVAGSAASIPPEARRRSATPAKVSTPIGTAASRRSKRAAPGPVIDDPEGGAAVSVGVRKTAPRKRGSMGASRSKQRGAVVQSQEEAAGGEVDPDEERYCICGDVSYGDMVKCENNQVSDPPEAALLISSTAVIVVLTIWQCDSGEWFHFECMGMTEAPGRRTKWWCPACRKKLGKD